MRILLTNHALRNFYGTETWTYTMAKELAGAGHRVFVWSPDHGLVSEKIEDITGAVTLKQPISDLDFAIVNHNDCLEVVLAKCDCPTIFTTHGISSSIEKPTGRADMEVAVSEETSRGTLPILRNPIDTQRFSYQRDVSFTLNKVLYLSHPHYAATHTKRAVQKACEKVGAEAIILQHQMWDIEEMINEVDLVIGFGRGILEAAACCRNVISADYRPYYMETIEGGGFITPGNFDVLKQDQFTGRLLGLNRKRFTVDKLVDELKKYNPEVGLQLRQQVLAEFKVERIAEQYVQMYKSFHRWDTPLGDHLAAPDSGGAP